MTDRPLIGVGVCILRDRQVLMGKRLNAHGEGCWCFPGGHLEFGEAIEECARREVYEETGIQIKNLSIGPFTNDIFTDEGKHYVTLFIIADYAGGDIDIKEPDKCEEWKWFDQDRLPDPLFLPVRNLLKKGFTFEKKQTRDS